MLLCLCGVPSLLLGSLQSGQWAHSKLVQLSKSFNFDKVILTEPHFCTMLLVNMLYIYMYVYIFFEVFSTEAHNLKCSIHAAFCLSAVAASGSPHLDS